METRNNIFIKNESSSSSINQSINMTLYRQDKRYALSSRLNERQRENYSKSVI